MTCVGLRACQFRALHLERSANDHDQLARLASVLASDRNESVTAAVCRSWYVTGGTQSAQDVSPDLGCHNSNARRLRRVQPPTPAPVPCTHFVAGRLCHAAVRKAIARQMSTSSPADAASLQASGDCALARLARPPLAHHSHLLPADPQPCPRMMRLHAPPTRALCHSGRQGTWAASAVACPERPAQSDRWLSSCCVAALAGRSHGCCERRTAAVASLVGRHW